MILIGGKAVLDQQGDKSLAHCAIMYLGIEFHSMADIARLKNLNVKQFRWKVNYLESKGVSRCVAINNAVDWCMREDISKIKEFLENSRD